MVKSTPELEAKIKASGIPIMGFVESGQPV